MIKYKQLKKISSKWIAILIMSFVFNKQEIIAQNIYATYSRKVKLVSVIEGKTVQTPLIEYKMHVFIKKLKVYAYVEPLYLEKYPDGNMKYTVEGINQQVNNFLSIEPKQNLETIDYDSLIHRYFFHNPPSTFNGKTAQCSGRREYFKFIRPYQPWIFLDETKTIQGIECQHAKLYSSTNELICDAWFAPGIPIPGFVLGLTDLPGLLVECYLPGISTNLSLLSYNTQVNIPDETFWPECFDGNFIFRSTLKPYKTNKTK
jgi:GLPGLI family protein